MDTKSLETNANEAKAKGFQAWLDKEETRMLFATVPEVSQHEVFLGLLRSSYNSGFSMGEGTIAVAILGEMLRARERPRT
jgi:hypothetical protein